MVDVPITRSIDWITIYTFMCYGNHKSRDSMTCMTTMIAGILVLKQAPLAPHI
jgi:hypothetical protein